MVLKLVCVYLGGGQRKILIHRNAMAMHNRPSTTSKQMFLIDLGTALFFVTFKLPQFQ